MGVRFDEFHGYVSSLFVSCWTLGFGADKYITKNSCSI